MLALLIAFLLPANARAQSLEDGFTEAAVKNHYKIYINRTQSVVRIFKLDDKGNESELVKTFVCSCGREGHTTPKDTYYTEERYEWRLMVDASYARYCVRIGGKLMFHSVPYLSENNDDLETEEYNKLGGVASLGCVRLSVADAKWIYYNIPEGTQVVLYSDDEDPTPLYKPQSLKLPAGSPFSSWDPTDDDPDNPWLTEEHQRMLANYNLYYGL